jgi:ubiquitin C-terminal hydrolase
MQYDAFEMNDANEFYDLFVDELKECILADSSSSHPIGRATCLHGRMEKSKMCNECGTRAIVANEPFSSLKVRIDNIVSVDPDRDIKECLYDLVKPEELEDPILCEQCQRRTNTTIAFTISALPEVPPYRYRRILTH